MKYFFSKDRVVGLVSLIVGVLVLAGSASIPVFPGTGDPGSRLFPQISGIIMTIMGAALIAVKPQGKAKQFLNGKQWKKLLLLYGIYVLFYAGWLLLGYPVASAVFLYAVCTLFSKGQNVPLWQRIVFAVGFSLAIYLIFNTLLGIRLPMGMIFGG